jgi:hypothetical protein
MSISPASAGFTSADPGVGAAGGVVEATGADGRTADEVDIDPPPQAQTRSAEVATPRRSGMKERLTTP